MDDFTFDPMDEATRRDPYPLYARGRRDHPIYAHRNLPVVSVFRHADIVNIFGDTEAWSSNFAMFIQPYLLTQPELAAEFPPFFATTDGDVHHRQRLLVNKAFTPKMVGALETSMLATARELIASAAAEDAVDLIPAFTAPFPVRVIGKLIGVPEADAPKFLKWSRELTESQVQGILKPPDPEFIARQIGSTRAMHDYFKILVQQRSVDPLPDLVTALAQVEEEGTRLSTPEMLQMLTILLIAGNATTTAMLGNLIVELLAHPEQLERLRADHSLIPSTVQEVLRYSSPVQAMPRLCARATRLDGVDISAGQFVLLWIGSANRDEAVFDRADDFDVGRTPNQHIAFGFGSHSCIGSHLASIEGCIVLRALLEGTRSFELVNREPLPMHSSFVARSYRSLPVHLVAV